MDDIFAFFRCINIFLLTFQEEIIQVQTLKKAQRIPRQEDQEQAEQEAQPLLAH